MARISASPDLSAAEVAEYLVGLAASEPEPDYLSPMRLQKLLYYAQAWSLALRNRPLFRDGIEAWTHGPVVRQVYAKYADNKDRMIQPSGRASKLEAHDQTFVRSIWDAYKEYSATALRNMTHGEDPWKLAHRGPSDGRPPGIISHESMREYFLERSTD